MGGRLLPRRYLPCQMERYGKMVSNSPHRRVRPIVTHRSIADHIPGRMVEVYYNRHKSLWSIRHRDKVRCYSETVYLRDCEFIVNEKGRQRVINEKKRNVHAFVRGYVIDEEPEDFPYGDGWDVVYYNPYKTDKFLFGLERPIDTASNVVMICSSATPVLAKR